MNQSEWFELVQLQMAYWSNTKISPEMAKLQYVRVKDVPVDAARAVLESWTGDFPPTVIQIAQEAGKLVAADLPDFDQVRPAFMKLGHDRDRFPTLEAWQAKGYHPVFAVYFTRQRWRQWCDTSENDTTFVAQQREEWRSLTGRSKRELELLIAGIDREALRSGRGEPGKLNAAVALGVGASEDDEEDSE